MVNIFRFIFKKTLVLSIFVYCAVGSKATSSAQQLDSLAEDPIVALLGGQEHANGTIENGSGNDNGGIDGHQPKSLAEAEALFHADESEDRNAIPRNGSRRWRMLDSLDGRVIVPYNISGNFTNEQVGVIRQAMDAIENNTCIKYVYLDELLSGDAYDGYYVDVTNERSGCGAVIGRTISGKQSAINLEANENYNCIEDDIVFHELLHGLGLSHEQNRPDSEDYIIVHYSNIEPERRSNFKPDLALVTYGLPYDYTSIMHYRWYDFAINSSELVIETKDPKYQNVIGQAKQPSIIDYQKICSIYECSECVGLPFTPPKV